MTTATQPLAGTWKSDPVHSSFGFAVVYQGISTFRGTFDEVSATLAPNTNGELELEGRAKVESISIRQPEAFRAHVLSDEFFGAERADVVVVRGACGGDRRQRPSRGRVAAHRGGPAVHRRSGRGLGRDFRRLGPPTGRPARRAAPGCRPTPAGRGGRGRRPGSW